jgi:hypothetical protein
MLWPLATMRIYANLTRAFRRNYTILVATQFRSSHIAHFSAVSALDGWLKMQRDQNPRLSSRFDPKFADFSDSELLTIVAGEADKGTVAMPWRVSCTQ